MRKIGAYFTVEAALVLPVVFGVILLVIYLLFFQYDRCLMEQSAGVLAMRGCTLQIKDREELACELLRQSEKADTARYLAFRAEKEEIRLRGNLVTVRQSGELTFPFRGFLPGVGKQRWKSEIVYENRRIAPVNFVRNCRKIMGGK